jgi:hypothetical protein
LDNHRLVVYGHLTAERRLDEERVQLEAKKREREEQHLFLTAKASNTFLGVLSSYGLDHFPRSSLMRPSLVTRALI